VIILKKDSEEEKQTPDPKEELDRILDEAEQQGKEIADRGREVTSAGQSMSDLARATRASLPYLPENADLEFLIDDWSEYSAQGIIILKDLEELPLYAMQSTAGTAYVTTSGTFNSENIIPYTPPPLQDEARRAISNVHQVMERTTEAGKVEKLLQSLGLDKAPKGLKSPLELFQTAHNAYQTPVAEGTPASTSLVPMRECIRNVIDEMLKRRPTQEKAKNEWSKIVSIGTQLKREAISMQTVDSWARQWEEILGKELSSSKDQEMTREEWGRRLQRATLFLQALLSGLDPEKMKRK
jgi:hypothetical protein